MDNSSPSMLKPTLIAGLPLGLVAGVLSGVPFLGCSCCVLIIGAGVLAAYLYSNESKKAGVGFSPRNGALVGLVAGLFYAVGHTIGSAFHGGPSPDEIDQVVEQMEGGGAPPEAVDMVLRVFEILGSGFGIVIVFCVILLFAAVFTTIGGLIGGAIFKVAPPSPPSTETPTPGAGGMPGA